MTALRIFLILCSLVLIISQLQAGAVFSKIDPSGKTVFYNIPSPKPSISGSFGAIALYYSTQAQNYLSMIQEICSRYQVDTELVKAVIQVESNYNPGAISPKGAMGLMQLMPATAVRYGVQQAFDPGQNIEGGVKYLRDLLDLFDSDLRLVVAAYNAGEGAVARYSGIPNYTETQNYVRKVMALYQGETSYTPFSGSIKPRVATYYKYEDQKGVTHYSAQPVSGVDSVRVTFYY